MGEQIVRAETLCVNPGGTGGCYDSIQAAIDASGVIDTMMQDGGDRLAALQNDDGGWDWPLDDGNPANQSPKNTVGPIAMGLAQAYLHTGDPDHLATLEDAGAFLLSKTNDFSPSDGYLAAMLDQVFGGTTYTDHVTTYFYNELAAGTYDRKEEGTLYDTATYVQKIRDDRAGNLAAWDIGMGLVGAASAGASTAEWIAGVKAEIDELDGAAYYDVIGLAGAVYGLAFVSEDFDPTTGEHAAAGSVSDLAVILAGYQIDGGGFTWSANYLNPDEGNETIQETAYAILALNEVDREGYLFELQGAADYMRSVQLVTGGWENYTGSGENHEITGEALWGHVIVYPAGGTTILVAAGTYNETININKDGLSIIGENRTAVVIDSTGLATNNAGIYVNADNGLLQSLTLQSTVTNSLPRYGIKFGEVDGCTLEDVTARDVYRSGIDALGASNLTVSNVSSLNNGGHGLSLVDCNDVAVTDITLSGNGWQNCSVATWGRYTPLGTSGIVFSGANSFGDLFQLEMGDYNNPGVLPAGDAVITYSTNPADGADVTVQASDFGFALHGEQDDSPGQARIWFFSTLANAAIVPGLGGGGHWTGNAMYIESLTDGTQLYVTPGCSIQAAVDAASSGDTVNVSAGTYPESILIEKSLTLLGATAGVNKNGYIVPSDYAWDDTVESIINHPDPSGGYMAIVDIHDVDNVTFDGFVVQELNAEANKNTSLVRVYALTREISNINVVNNVIGPNTNTTAQDGAQGRMGLYIVNHPYDDKGVVNSTFAGNKIFDCKGNGDNVFLWTSYYAYGAPGPASMMGTVIEDNEIYGAHRSGIETAGGFSHLTIRGNVIYGNSGMVTDDPDKLKYGHGIQLIRGSSDKVSDPLTAYGPVNLTIEYNEIYGNEKNGIYMGPKNDSITFTGNRIYDNGWDGIMLDLEGNYWNPTFEDPPASLQYACYGCSNNVVASNNDIYDNGTAGNPIVNYGVQVIGVPTNGFIFDAKYNWWGDASGPLDPGGTNETDGETCYAPSTMRNEDGTGNGVSDLYVNYCPWQLWDNPDIDDDGICNPYTVHPDCNGSDNCPETPNPEQEDTFPPDGNGVGDECECEADFDHNRAVDADDVEKFLWDFGRSLYYNPCTENRPCYGDFQCDGGVDADDVEKFLEDFGRSLYYNPCPRWYSNGAWCSY
jgi:pectin methylesterase-like acyl-CoA thioesterase